MKETTGTVVKGSIRLPESVSLPEGTTVRILWEEEQELKPLEREPLLNEEVMADIRWATGKQFEK
jgi:hypothetical protein